MSNLNEIEASAVNQGEQMEMGFPARKARRVVEASNRQRRAQRAQWWFRQMRRVVDRAMDWQTPPARAEQGYLTLAGRRN
jgi:hypothetical protein